MVNYLIIKKKIETTRNKKKKHNEIVMLTRSKLNGIENTISKTLIDNEISHENFTTIINELKELIESIRMMKSQRNDIERNKLIEDGKKIGIDKIIRQNERINYNLKSQV